MKIRFTEHAVDRFIERRMPQATHSQAVCRMNELIQSGSFLKEKTLVGDSQILADGVVFVLKHDRGDGVTDCATVLFDLRACTNPLAQEIEQFGRVPIELVAAPIPKRRRSRRSSRW